MYQARFTPKTQNLIAFAASNNLVSASELTSFCRLPAVQKTKFVSDLTTRVERFRTRKVDAERLARKLDEVTKDLALLKANSPDLFDRFNLAPPTSGRVADVGAFMYELPENRARFMRAKKARARRLERQGFAEELNNEFIAEVLAQVDMLPETTVVRVAGSNLADPQFALSSPRLDAVFGSSTAPSVQPTPSASVQPTPSASVQPTPSPQQFNFGMRPASAPPAASASFTSSFSIPFSAPATPSLTMSTASPAPIVATSHSIDEIRAKMARVLQAQKEREQQVELASKQAGHERSARKNRFIDDKAEVSDLEDDGMDI
jgi:hypothetical protein